MKKYNVTIEHEGTHTFLITARNEKSARNKAVRRANELKFITLGEYKITVKDIVHIEYEGFYLNGRFIPVSCLD